MGAVSVKNFIKDHHSITACAIEIYKLDPDHFKKCLRAGHKTFIIQCCLELLKTTTQMHYPSATEWMWNYCTYLGPYVDDYDSKWDLGIYLSEDSDTCFAIVHGNDPGNYMSTDINTYNAGNVKSQCKDETLRRAKLFKLI